MENSSVGHSTTSEITGLPIPTQMSALVSLPITFWFKLNKLGN